MVKGHGLFQVARQTEIGYEPVRASYYWRMLGVRSRWLLIGNKARDKTLKAQFLQQHLVMKFETALGAQETFNFPNSLPNI